MSERAAHRPHHPPHPAQRQGIAYFHFGFFRIDPAYKRLLPNEKVVAKQEFLSIAETFDERVALLTYSLIGLRADCDVLLWRISSDLEALQEMAARSLQAGIGKFLLPAYAYLAVPSEPLDVLRGEEGPGRRRFAVVQHSQRTPDYRLLPKSERQTVKAEEDEVKKRYPSVKFHHAAAFGQADRQVLALESDRSQDLHDATRALRSGSAARYSLPGEAFAGLRHDLGDILDQLG